MSRKTKFRIWDNYSKYFIKDTDTDKYYLSPNGDIIIIDEIGFIYETDKENYIINSYTGLNNIEKYEIYENDIVWNRQNDEYQVVVFEGGEYKLMGESHIQNLYDELDHIDIRGNVYENFELVKTWYKE